MSDLSWTAQDDALKHRIWRGDTQALAEFIVARQAELLGFIRKRMNVALQRRVSPEDVLQEMTVSALAAAPAVDWGDRDPFNWLCHQAERRIIDAHRRHYGAQKRSADKEVSLHSPGRTSEAAGGLADLLAASMTTPSAAFTRQEKQYHMLQALNALSEDAREALRLRYVEGLPSKDIAARLGRTDGAVRVLLTRSLQKLQDLLSENSDFQTLVAQDPPKPTSD